LLEIIRECPCLTPDVIERLKGVLALPSLSVLFQENSLLGYSREIHTPTTGQMGFWKCSREEGSKTLEIQEEGGGRG